MKTLAFIVALIDILPCPTIEELVNRACDPCDDPTGKLDEDLGEFAKTLAKRLAPTPAPPPACTPEEVRAAFDVSQNPVFAPMLGQARYHLAALRDSLLSNLGASHAAQARAALSAREDADATYVQLKLEWTRPGGPPELLAEVKLVRNHDRFMVLYREAPGKMGCGFAGNILQHKEVSYGYITSQIIHHGQDLFK